nr:immunoglobulin light chain junction region [Macaca mulatta]MOX12191.1 immunoglobulin light chain junction region [Macaca mulatta]MOX12199.1 immunoglobulin light chain junction region [Macaca mulatta]MOX13539.1 immunoglobulin light chain junction region [Macaca mulatta]MOX14429.1 immunoglobulin light chain junction region [Macaca mulatta]
DYYCSLYAGSGTYMF